MATIAEAIAWAGSEVMLSMFTVSDSITAAPLSLSLEPAPVAVRTFALEDERGALGGQFVIEYDLVLREVPSDLELVLRQCLLAAHAAGARVAWFGFEGSFDYEFLLTKEIANQVYAVSDSHGPSIASDDTLSSKAWETRVVRAGLEARRASEEFDQAR